jgi:adhesin transport system membrane fusion protein
MLNISPNSIQNKVEKERFSSFELSELSGANRMFTRWLLGTFLIVFVLLFFPWTQNIQTKGKVTTLSPNQRPQEIHSTIGGRIEKWYVQEGQLVEKGDTIVFLSEIKDAYFDPELIDRTSNQVKAKEMSVVSYGQKVDALENQIGAMEKELELKINQLENKVRQSELKVESNRAALEQARIDFDIAAYQMRRMDTLLTKGIESLTKLEEKRLKMQETKAKVVAAENKLLESENDVMIAKLALSNIRNEFAGKIAKAQADKFTTLSTQFDAEGDLNKLRSQLENYDRRSSFYFIRAPQDCYITKAIKPGIGEVIKEGDPVVSIMPADFELAVELYIEPIDFPLVQPGQEVRFIFDGWPAFIFSGWPDMSFGTFSGEVFAIDNTISNNGKYRILIRQSMNPKPWPEALRIGAGAQGIALLNRVPVWYEVWRRLNGFPPDFYAEDQEEKPKMKAPAKSIPK